METPADSPPPDSSPHLGKASKRLAQLAMVICENRVELLLVEVLEERERMLRAFWLSLGTAVLALLAGVALTMAFVVACWEWSPLGALVILAAVYGGGAGLLYRQLSRLRRDWETLPETISELRKDREWLEKSLN